MNDVVIASQFFKQHAAFPGILPKADNELYMPRKPIQWRPSKVGKPAFKLIDRIHNNNRLPPSLGRYSSHKAINFSGS